MEKSKLNLKENVVCYECKKEKLIYFEVFRLVSIRKNKKIYMKQLFCEECLNEL